MGVLAAFLISGCARRGAEPYAGLLARVEIVSEVPDPETAPYADCLMHIKLLAEVNGDAVAAGQGFVGVMWAFEARELGEAPTLRTGDRIAIGSMIAFDRTDAKLRQLMRVDDTEDLTSDIFWIEQWAVASRARGPRAEKRAEPGGTDVNERILKVLAAHEDRAFGRVGQNFKFGSSAYLTDMANVSGWDQAGTSLDGSRLPPLDAITHFKGQLDVLGIELLVAFRPDSLTVFADYATNIAWDPSVDGRIDAAVIGFVQVLKDRGISVIDLTPLILENLFETGPDGIQYPAFVRSDMHWSPRSATIAAQVIAERIKAQDWYAQYSSEPGRPVINSRVRRRLLRSGGGSASGQRPRSRPSHTAFTSPMALRTFMTHTRPTP